MYILYDLFASPECPSQSEAVPDEILGDGGVQPGLGTSVTVGTGLPQFLHFLVMYLKSHYRAVAAPESEFGTPIRRVPVWSA